MVGVGGAEVQVGMVAIVKLRVAVGESAEEGVRVEVEVADWVVGGSVVAVTTGMGVISRGRGATHPDNG